MSQGWDLGVGGQKFNLSEHGHVHIKLKLMMSRAGHK